LLQLAEGGGLNPKCWLVMLGGLVLVEAAEVVGNVGKVYLGVAGWLGGGGVWP